METRINYQYEPIQSTLTKDEAITQLISELGGAPFREDQLYYIRTSPLLKNVRLDVDTWERRGNLVSRLLEYPQWTGTRDAQNRKIFVKDEVKYVFVWNNGSLMVTVPSTQDGLVTARKFAPSWAAWAVEDIALEMQHHGKRRFL